MFETLKKVDSMINRCQKEIWHIKKSLAIKSKEKFVKNHIIIPDNIETELSAKKIFQEYSEKSAENIRSILKKAVKNKKRIVLIYQMGKVGSSSLNILLKKVDEFEVFHLHRLNKSSNSKMIGNFLKQRNVKMALQERDWFEISDFIEHEKQIAHIVTAIRDPIDRNISAFFENIDVNDIKNCEIETLIEKFINEYPHEVPLKWFDEQFKNVLGIDILQYPFNKERGWSEIYAKNLNCLLLTAETDDTVKLAGLNRFFGLKLEKIVRTNIGDNKAYSDIYKAFKKQIKLPESYLTKMLKSNLVEHFYTNEKIEKFYNKWRSF